MTEAIPVPQFGAPAPGREPADRPAAFGVAARDGLIALVRIARPGEADYLDLPGGALDPGETDEAALVREFGEETGLVVRPVRLMGRADQYFTRSDGEPVNNRAALFAVEVERADPGLKIEDDHDLVWLAPEEALRRLRHDSHAWAVALWMRTGRGVRGRPSVRDA